MFKQLKTNSWTCADESEERVNEKNDTFESQYVRNWASQVAQVVKSLPASAGDTRDMGSIPRSGGSPGEENGKYCLELLGKKTWLKKE